MSYMDCCDWDKCTECGECLVKCPVMQMGSDEAKSEFGLLLRGEEPKRVFKECTFCFNCNNYCPVEGLRPHELILQRMVERRKSVSPILQYLMNGMPLPTFFQDMYSWLGKEEKEILSRWSETPPPTDEILWVGCIGRLSCYDLENSVVLKDLPKFGPAELCCGELAYRLGTWEAYADTIERTLKRFKELDIKRMVCYCGSCYSYLSNILPKVYGKELPFKLITMYEWILERVEQGKLELKKPLNFKAAVHESCYVSELGGLPGTLRKLYKAAGMEVVELEHHGENNLSCGAVSVLRNMNPFKSLIKEQRKKHRERKASGSKEMALNCPGCYITLSFTKPFLGGKLRYMPDELLRAYGDNISKPLSKRIKLVLKAFILRGPGLLLKKGKNVLPRVSVDA